MSIGYHRDLDLTMAAAEERVRETLAAEGFGVLTEIDVQATLKQKLDADFRPYKILGACQPSSALQALSIHPEVGLLLPCNVTVSANDDGSVRVAAIDAQVMFTVIDNQELADLATEVGASLRRAIDAI
ncbi:MAG: DUF302 domain-containing protein [Candidatus Marinimicrobia bacterium]|nr:DUF302 domain-containing protein [Candidatus Neomarinimicrobiota bacterium]